MSDTKNVLEIPEIPDNAQFRKLLSHYNDMQTRADQAKRQLLEELHVFQQACKHSFEAERGDDLFVGQRCKKCKLFLSHVNDSSKISAEL